MKILIQFISIEALVALAALMIHIFTGATGWPLVLASSFGGLLFFTSGVIFVSILDEV